MTLDQLLLILLLLLVIVFVFKTVKPNGELIINIPGPRTLPLVGNCFSLIGRGGNAAENFLDFVSSLRKLYGRRSKFFIGMTPYVVLTDPNDIQKLLSSDVHVNKPPMYKFFNELFGVSLFSSPAKSWWPLRKLLNPSFKYSVLESFLPVMNFEANLCVKKLEEKATEEPGKALDVSGFMTNLTMDILAKTAMDVEIKSQSGNKSEFAEALGGALSLCTKRWLSPWLHPDIVWKFSSTGIKFNNYKNAIHQYTDKVIRERRKIRSNVQQDRNAKENSEGLKTTTPFLDTLLDLQEDGNCISDTQIRSETNLFLAAGHETTATSLQWLLARLGYHKDIQEKVHSELDMIFEGDHIRPVTSADLRRMEYLEMVIKESLRLHPVVPMFLREVEVPLHLDGGAVIKPGVTVMIHAAGVHKESTFFPSPEKFIPERFNPQESASRHPYSFLTFSLGPRMCMGHKFAMLELKITVAHILRCFNISCDVNPSHIRTEFLGVVRPVEGVRVSFTPRK